MQKSLRLVVFLSCCFLVGCVHINEISPQCVSSRSNEKVFKFKQKHKINVNVIDGRGLNDPNLIANYDFLAEKIVVVSNRPVSSFIKRVLKEGLAQMNFEIVDAKKARYLLNCNINNVRVEVRDSFVFVMNIYCYLIDKKSNNIVWQDTITSEGVLRERKLFDDVLNDSFCIALTDFVREIQNLKPFRIALGG